MLKTLAPYIVLAIYNVLMLGGFSVATYRTPRDFFISLSSFGLMVWWVCGASFINISGVEGMVLGGLVLWWLVTTFISKRTDLTIPPLIPVLGVIAVCVMLEFNLIGLQILCISGLLSAIFANLEKHLKWSPFKLPSHRGYPIGFGGNTIHLGIACLCYFFLSLYLSIHVHWVWSFASILFLYTLTITKCRGAFVGLSVSLLYYVIQTGHWYLGLSLVLAGILFYINYYFKATPQSPFNSSTFKDRMKYWHTGWIQLRKTPLFGLGMGVYATKVPFIKSELLRKSDRFRTYPNHRHVHNDFLQHAIDFGILGLLGYLGWIYLVLSKTADPVLVSGFIGLLVASLFFHTLDIPYIRPFVWLLGLFILQLGGTGQTQVPVWSWIPVAIYGIFVFRFMFREFLADIFLAPVYKNQIDVPPLVALSYKPNLTIARTHCVGRYLRRGDLFSAFNHAVDAINHYDGNQVYWELWNNLGVVLMSAKSFDLALKCFERALVFKPDYESALRNIQQIRNFKNNKLGGV